MNPTQNLPENYHLVWSLDLSKNIRAAVWLNILATLLLLVFGWAFIQALFWLRPREAASVLSFSAGDLGAMLGGLAYVLLCMVVMIVLHEAIHGLFFWLFTRARPVFAFRWAYAYAALPGWYLPSGLYLMTALAPLVLISLLGLVLMPWLPTALLPGLLLVLILNASGAVGDLWVAGALLRHPAHLLANDRGDAVLLYA